ncbi:MAG: lipid A deacylase LpxR family protein [Bdellovibrionaceae bacterium]|nr:lipid A deacylase LpxR family protein [Pseudobdellovibrionaceae bacterium]
MKLLTWLLMGFVVVPAWAQSDEVSPSGRTFGVYVENDSRSVGGPGSDQGYSSGIKFSYLFAENNIPAWANPALASMNILEQERKKSKSNFGFSMGHQIYTPNKTSTSEFIPNDRPYAAWLYLAFSAHFKTPTHGHYWELATGIVGPEAQGASVQNEFHRIIDSPRVNGWEHQLGTEPTLQLSYQQRLKSFEIFQEQSRVFDVIPFYGAGFGNVLIAAHAGALVRIGYHLPDDLGPTRPSPTGGDIFISPKRPGPQWDWSFYGFAGARGHAIARSLFLDGNTFRKSHSVKRYPFVGETEFGAAGEIGNWSLIWRFVTKTPEFEEKSRFNSFGSLTLSYTFL